MLCRACAALCHGRHTIYGTTLGVVLRAQRRQGSCVGWAPTLCGIEEARNWPPVFWPRARWRQRHRAAAAAFRMPASTAAADGNRHVIRHVICGRPVSWLPTRSFPLHCSCSPPRPLSRHLAGQMARQVYSENSVVSHASRTTRPAGLVVTFVALALASLPFLCADVAGFRCSRDCI